MTIKMNITAQERKTLVTAIAEITGEKAIYKGMPSAAYEIGNFTVTREGLIETGETDEMKVKALIECLKDRGIESEQNIFEGTEEESTEVDVPEIDEVRGTAIQMPLTQFTEAQLQNLYNLVEAKGALIKKTLGVQELPINIIDNRLDFPWFAADSTPEELNAYMHFVTALCDMAKKQKRISPKSKEAENEKYAFRCFLLRLGFIGDEYKMDRKILLKNLSGSAAFKNKKDKREEQEVPVQEEAEEN